MPKATTVDGVELYYEVRGNPNATNKVVFVMGLSGSHRGWDMQSSYFASLPDYQILVFDNRGAGFSHSPTAPYTTETMAADAIFLAGEAGFQRFHVVGVSMGGMIAQHIALSAPDKVVSLTLLVTRLQGGFLNHLPTFKGIVQFYKMQSAVNDPEALINAGADLLFPGEYLEKDSGNGKKNREILRDMVIQRNKEVPLQGPEGKKNQLAAVRAHGLTNPQLDLLKNAKFPILAIVGDQDTLIRPNHSYYMPQQIAADLLIVEGAGHGVMQQCPELVNTHMREHMERAASGLPRDPHPKTVKVHYTYTPATKATLQSQAEAVEAMEKLSSEI